MSTRSSSADKRNRLACCIYAQGPRAFDVLPGQLAVHLNYVIMCTLCADKLARSVLVSIQTQYSQGILSLALGEHARNGVS